MAVSDFEGERVIRRVTIVGDRVEPLNPAWPHYEPVQHTISARAERVDAVAGVNY
jgi:hypothetical protein